MATLARLADANVRGSEAARVRSPGEATTWSPEVLARSSTTRRAEDAQAERLPDPWHEYRTWTPRYGYPGAAKGAIYALDPDDLSRGDVLYFSRYPRELIELIEAMLASDTTPGRAYPAFQQMGAKGVKLSTELWFCDAFLWSRHLRASVGEISSNHLKAQATLAEQARTFFEFYVAGHDGTGLALPPADLYLHWGDRLMPIPIVIERVELRQEDFTSAPEGPRAGYKPGGVPQTLTVKLDMQVNVPLRVSDPFRPKKPEPPKGKPPRGKTCITPGQLIDGTQVLLSATAISVPGWGANIGLNTAPLGFQAP